MTRSHMPGDVLYEERVSSVRTQALFWTLTALFFALATWRAASAGPGGATIALLLAGLLFLFHSLNYRTLVIRLTPVSLELRFGVFARVIPLDDIADCRPDDVSGLMRYGGAGIHFMLMRGRYRVSFNHLEHPRVVIALKGRRLVREVSFTTKQPDRLVPLVRHAASR